MATSTIGRLRRVTAPVVVVALVAAFVAALGATSAQADACTPVDLNGVAQVGQTLSVASQPGDTSTYQWFRQDPSGSGGGWTAVVAATASSYLVTADDLGQTLEVVVTGGGVPCRSATSAVVVGADGALLGTPPTAPTASRPFAVGTLRRLSGRPLVGRVLRTTGRLPAGATVRYRWFRASHATVRQIKGARSATYRLRRADRSRRVFVRLWLTAPGYTSVVVRSARVLVR